MSGWLRQFVVMIALLACGFFVSPMVFAQMSYQFDLPEQSLADSLRAIGRQTDMNIVFEPESVMGIRGVAVHGQFTADEAIRLVLAGTNLQAEHTAASNVVVKPKLAKSSSADSSSMESEGKITEIIVTAEKQAERLQDVPVPIAVINTQQLLENNQTSLQDYYNTIPSLSIAPVGSQGYQPLIIRGISAGAGHDPTVGVTIDDAPVTMAQNIGAGNALPDIDPNDLERIEVLRGPQGTLYGANSMGGLIRYVTKDPTPDSLKGNVTAGTSYVENGAELGYNFRASANIPVNSDLAVRVSGYTYQVPGYIDNPFRGIDGINEEHASGASLAAKWQPSGAVSLKLGARYQHVKEDGSSEVGIGLGDLQQNFAPGTGGLEANTQAYSAVLNAKLGAGVELTSVTAYNIMSQHASLDYTFGFGPAVQQIFQVPNAPCSVIDGHRSFSQEIRFSGSGPVVDWLAGTFYTYQDGAHDIYFNAQTAQGVIVGDLLNLNIPDNYREYAGFATLTYHVTDLFDVQFGGRESHIESHQNEITSGYFYGYTPTPQPQPPASNNVFTYLVTPRFKLTPDLMIYARVASGYRPGGHNAVDPVASAVPPEYNSDKTQNYELGLKADLLEHRLSIDTSVYYIDWKDIQLNVTDPVTNFFYIGNGSGAKSEGVELAITSHPLTGLTISGWVSYDDAALTKAAPAGSIDGLPGYRLPYVSRWSGSISAQQDFPLTGELKGFVGAQVNLVGDRLGEFANCSVSISPCPAPATPRQYYSSYAQTNLRAGAKYGAWSANLFVNNLADKRGQLGGGIGATPSTGMVIIQPRTVGLNLSRAF